MLFGNLPPPRWPVFPYVILSLGGILKGRIVRVCVTRYFHSSWAAGTVRDDGLQAHQFFFFLNL